MSSSEPEPGDITRLLNAWRDGDSSAFGELVPLVYRELHNLAVWQMRGEKRGHTLSPTALLHESLLKLVTSGADQDFEHRKHFYLVAARAMRQLLIDHARRKNAEKRQPEFGTVTPSSIEDPGRWNVIDLDRALSRLEQQDPRRSKMLELRYFAGLTVREIGSAMNVSAATVCRELRVTEAWIAQEIKGSD